MSSHDFSTIHLKNIKLISKESISLYRVIMCRMKDDDIEDQKSLEKEVLQAAI